MKLKSTIEVHVREGGMGVVTRAFEDWFEFADWLKQETLANREVIIVGWNYVPRT